VGKSSYIVNWVNDSRHVANSSDGHVVHPTFMILKNLYSWCYQLHRRIFHWPGVIPSRGAVNGLFSLVDLMATTLGLAGCAVPVWSQGCDFSPLLRGETFTPPEDV